MSSWPRRTVYPFAGFLILFCVAVLALWLWGEDVFTVLLQRSRSYTPPQFLTWLSLVAALSLSAAFCLLPSRSFASSAGALMFRSEASSFASLDFFSYAGRAHSSGS
jgi:hypothetical protein